MPGLQLLFKELGHWRVPLSRVLRGQLGKKRGSYVYLVIATNPDEGIETVLYVGKTTMGVQDRLRRHLSGKVSPIGERILEMWPWDGWFMEVVSIEGKLSIAEYVYIQRYHPPYNIQANTLHTIL